jgi:NADH-quinone oxidoreductase subunit C
MDASALVAVLQEAVPGTRLEPLPSIDPQVALAVAREDLPAVARALRDRPELAFALLVELTAVDYWPREPRFEVVYILVSPARRRRLRLKVRLAGGEPHLPTVTGVWPAANWLEREVWDLYGIVFDGHPDLRRLLMPDDWEGHPLRRDYPVQVNLRVKTESALQVSEAEFRANLERDRRARRE